MYDIAEKYGVPGLKDLAKKKFSLACGVFWDSVEVAEAAEHVFTTTPEEDKGLRKYVVETLSAHREIVTKAGIKTFLQKRPELMYELLAQRPA